MGRNVHKVVLNGKRWSSLLSIKSSSNFVGIDKTANETTHDDDLFSLLDISWVFGKEQLKRIKACFFTYEGLQKGRIP